MIEHPAALDPLSGFPYSNVAVSGDLVAIASQVPFDKNHHVVGPNFAEQAHQVFANLGACLRVPGCSFPDVTNAAAIWRTLSPPYPARTTIACQLVVPGMLLQIEAFARRPVPK